MPHIPLMDSEDCHCIINTYGLSGNTEGLSEILRIHVPTHEHLVWNILFWAFVIEDTELIKKCLEWEAANYLTWNVKSPKKVFGYMLIAAMYRDDFEAFERIASRLNVVELYNCLCRILDHNYSAYLRPYPFTIQMKYVHWFHERTGEIPPLNWAYWAYQRAQGMMNGSLYAGGAKTFHFPRSPELIQWLESVHTPLQLEHNPWDVLRSEDRTDEEKAEALEGVPEEMIHSWVLDEHWPSGTKEIIQKRVRPITITIDTEYEDQWATFVTDLCPFVVDYPDYDNRLSRTRSIKVTPAGRDDLVRFFDVAARAGVTPLPYEIPEDPDVDFVIELEIDPDLSCMHVY